MSPRTATRVNSRTKGSTKDSNSREQKREKPKSRPRVSKPRTENAAKGTGESPIDEDAVPAIGENLRTLRTERNLSLDALSQMSGVSRAMLGQIELNRSVPTITVLWRIAKALDIPFSSLIREPEQKGPSVLRRAAARYLTSADGTFKSRALFPADGQRLVEFYEVRLAAGAIEDALPHAAGTFENLVVGKGNLEVTAGAAPIALGTGDAVVFRADVPHRYHNPGTGEAVVYMVISYAQHA